MEAALVANMAPMEITPMGSGAPFHISSIHQAMNAASQQRMRLFVQYFEVGSGCITLRRALSAMSLYAMLPFDAGR